MAKLCIIIAWPQRINTVALNLLLRILGLRKELWLTNLQIFEPIPGHGVFSYPTFFSIICVSYSFLGFGVFFFLMFIFERDPECERGRGRGRERGRYRIQSRPQAPGCQHRAWCRAQTHEQDLDLSRSQTLSWLNHPVSFWVSYSDQVLSHHIYMAVWIFQSFPMLSTLLNLNLKTNKQNQSAATGYSLPSDKKSGITFPLTKVLWPSLRSA